MSDEVPERLSAFDASRLVRLIPRTASYLAIQFNARDIAARTSSMCMHFGTMHDWCEIMSAKHMHPLFDLIFECIP